MTKQVTLPPDFLSTGQHPMPDKAPRDFRPKQIVCRELDGSARPIDYFYIDIDKPIPWRPTSNIDAFVKNIALNGYVRNGQSRPEVKKLDILISRDSYIVFQLSESSGLTFETTEDAIRLATPSVAYPNNVYGGLHYVDHQGIITTTRVAGCKLVFFSARHVKRSDGRDYTQGLNYNVVTAAGDLTPIDPDIRYPGVGDS